MTDTMATATESTACHTATHEVRAYGNFIDGAPVPAADTVIERRSPADGAFRAQDLGVQPGGLQPGPRLVERRPGVLGAVAQLRCSGGVSGGQRREEFFCRRFGPIGFRCAGAERGDGSDNCGDRQQAARP